MAEVVVELVGAVVMVAVVAFTFGVQFGRKGGYEDGYASGRRASVGAATSKTMQDLIDAAEQDLAKAEARERAAHGGGNN